MPNQDEETGEIVPILQKSLLERLGKLSGEMDEVDDAVDAAAAQANEIMHAANVKRKTAENQLVEALQGLFPGRQITVRRLR